MKTRIVLTISLITFTIIVSMLLMEFTPARNFIIPQTSALSPRISTIIIPKDSENVDSGKNFEPRFLLVVLGVNNTVRWINEAITPNIVVADKQDDPLFWNTTSCSCNDIIQQGKSFNFTFTKPGEFGYHSAPHPWLSGRVFVLSQSSNQITHFYLDPSLKPKVELYDYYYDGIDKDNATVSIKNETYYQTTLLYTDYDLKKGTSIQFHNVTFAFPEGVMITPGGALIMLDIKFQDGSEEIYGRNTVFSDGSGALSGIAIPAQFGPHLATNSTTVLGNHEMPQAGITIYNDKIKLLVSK